MKITKKGLRWSWAGSQMGNVRLFKMKAGHNFVLTCVLFACATTGHSQTYAFSTILGQAGQNEIIDGTNGSVRFYIPRCLAMGLSGNYFISDDSVVRMVTTAGTNLMVNTLAGTPHVNGGTDGTNSGALFNTPSGLAVDSATNIYVADWGDHTIRKITPTGTNWVVTTLAGMSGVAGSADGTNGDALFKNPFGVVLDNGGNLIVTDSENDTIRKVSPQGTNWIVATLAGSAGSAGSADGTNAFARFSTPRDVALDAAGSLYVTDFDNHTVRKITQAGTNWIVTTIAGMAGQGGTMDGTNATARFSGPDGIGLDGAGNIYVTDSTDAVIRKITPAGTNWVVSTIGGLAGVSGSTNGTGTNALFYYPDNIKVNIAGQLYIPDRNNDIIRQGVITTPSRFTFTAEHIGNGLFVIGGTNSVPFAAAYLLTSTSLQIPVSQWQSIATNWCDANGNLMFTNNLNASANQQFYRLQLP
jgi:hypothetical protein